jgi:hypothetical protein
VSISAKRSRSSRAPPSFVDNTLWPECLELQAALNSCLNEATERIIREEVYGDAGEAAERVDRRCERSAV